MNVLIIGSGGREHALAYKISESEKLDKLYIAPGNGGTGLIGNNVALNINNKSELLLFCKEKNIELAVIGPEQPLVDGMADSLRLAGIKVFGPSGQAAQIESDKAFAKALMKKYSVPTAEFSVYDAEQYEEAVNYLKNKDFPLVIKANGLAAGKGVAICNTFEEAKNTLEEYFIQKKFGAAGEKALIEEFMKGEEASVFAITDGTDYVVLPASQDHKRIGDNDTGVNTGGMGAYAPAPLITQELMNEIKEKVIEPTIEGMKKDGIPFVGCLYAGLMITEKGPQVVEFNCRFGDPETQAVLPLLKGDFLMLLDSAASGKLNREAVFYHGGSAVCVVAASGGYPGSYEKGKEISGLETLEQVPNILVFHAGTTDSDGKLRTSGGRVLGITAVLNDNDLSATIKRAYDNISKVKFDRMYYRSDIGKKGLK